MIRLAPLLLLVTFLGGCASVKPPAVRATGGEFLGLTDGGLRLGVDLEVANPNDLALPITGVGYTLFAEGVRVVRGDADFADGQALPANGSAALQLPVEVQWSDLLAARDALSASGGDFGYELRGDARFRPPGAVTSLIPMSVPFEYRGTLPLGQALRDPQLLVDPDARKLAAALFGSVLGR